MTVKKKVPTFPFFRSIGARMIERYIFNYRIKPEELRKRLPVSWLEPQVVNGFSIVSFCVLCLEKLTISPIPSIFPFNTISCAYRIGVMDVSEGAPVPSVYVIDRWADLPMIARLAPLILQDTIPVIKASVAHENDGQTRVQVSYTDRAALFTASARPLANGLGSSVFATVDEFAAFIKNGVGSYGPSLEPGKLTKVDLVKEEVDYQPLDATVTFSELDQESWADAGLEYDSTVRAKTSAKYVWTYRGLWSE